jgi:hypothetical protein
MIEALQPALRKALVPVLDALSGVSNNLKNQERTMAEVKDLIAKLTREVAETRTLIGSAVAFIQGVPGLIRAAVEEALAANQNLTPEDLVAVSDAADQLDAGQAELTAALTSGTEEPPAPAPEPEPAPTEL